MTLPGGTEYKKNITDGSAGEGKLKYSGFLAQEVEKAAKAANYEFSGYDTPKTERDLYKIKYAEFVVPLVKGMQEQQTIIDELKKQMAEMKREIELLKN